MSIMEQYNSELYHYGVKGMKWGVRRAIKQRDKIVRKHDKYVDKYQKAKAKGAIARAAKYEGKAWKERLKFEMKQQKIRDLDPERTKKAEEFVKQLMGDASQTKTTATTTSSTTNNTLSKNQETLKKAGIDPYWAPEGKIRLKQTTNKTPYYALDEKSRAAVDADYQSKSQAVLKRYKSATTEAAKRKAEQEHYELETEYQNIVERDW